MAILKFKGTVSTNKVGSECEFEFEINEEDLPEDPGERERMIDKIALEELWEYGRIDWGFEEVDSNDTEE